MNWTGLSTGIKRFVHRKKNGNGQKSPTAILNSSSSGTKRLAWGHITLEQFGQQENVTRERIRQIFKTGDERLVNDGIVAGLLNQKLQEEKSSFTNAPDDPEALYALFHALETIGIYQKKIHDLPVVTNLDDNASGLPENGERGDGKTVCEKYLKMNWPNFAGSGSKWIVFTKMLFWPLPMNT